MSEWPASVCIVTYNQADTIARCVESALSQCGGTVEVLVGDDASTDGTRGILTALAARHPERLVVVSRDANVGAFANLKDLVARARAPFIAHLDGDDFWLAGKLDAQLAQLAATPDAPAAVANALVADHGDRIIGRFSRFAGARITRDDLLRAGNFICHGTLVYRSAHRDVVLDQAATYIDYNLLLRLAARGALAYDDAPRMIYRWASGTSIRRERQRQIAALYWHALRDARDGADPRAWHAGVRGFVARFALDVLATRDVAGLRALIATIRDEGGADAARSAWLGVLASPFAAWRGVRRRLVRGAFGRFGAYYP